MDGPTDGPTDGPMDGPTDGPTDEPTDGQTHPLIETQGAFKNTFYEDANNIQIIKTEDNEERDRRKR